MNSSVAIGMVAVMAGSACALVGVFLVLRRMAMMSDAISHSILPGLVAAYALAQGPNFFAGAIGALAAGLTTVVAVEVLTKSRKVREDSAIGIVFPAMFAIGVLAVSRFFANVHLDADAVLFGEIAFAPFDSLTFNGLDIGPKSFWVLAGLGALNLGFVLGFYKELKLSTFDPALAASLGFMPALLHYMLMGLVALTTVGAFSAVGAILAVSLIVVPAVTATQLSTRLPVVIGLSVVVAAVSGLVGYGVAVWLDVSISGMIAVVLGVAFLLATTPKMIRIQRKTTRAV